MADFINTIEALGDDAVIDSIIDKSITEFKDNTLETVGQYAFYKCNALETVDLPAVTAIDEYAFNYCEGSLVNVNIPNITAIPKFAFQYCKKLTTVDFPLVTSIGDNAFNMCTELTNVDFPNATSIGINAFNGCQKLANKVRFPLLTTANQRIFQGCWRIPSIDLPVCTSIAAYAFYECRMLTALILRSGTMCTLAATTALVDCYHIEGKDKPENPGGLKDGYIYVPRALLSDVDATKDYRRATNWSTYATQFRALEDYTVDGTITGELDETKI